MSIAVASVVVVDFSHVDATFSSAVSITGVTGWDFDGTGASSAAEISPTVWRITLNDAVAFVGVPWSLSDSTGIVPAVLVPQSGELA
jgi:hypothetical protein